MRAPLSVVIPTLNAARHLPACLAALAPGAADELIREVIIADGGSDDATSAIARDMGCALLDAPRGRATQMIAGAGAAKGEWLLFLHADTVLSHGWEEAVWRHIETRPAKAAVFTLAYDSDHRLARWLARRANRRTRWFALPYGDQGLLISRALYDEIGGFRPLPLMEDVDIVRRIGRRRLHLLSTQAVTSAEKYERDGYRKRAYRNGWLLTRYLLGASPEKLARLYD